MIKKTYPNYHETVYIYKLKNGMQIHVMPQPAPFYSTYVELSVPYGALDLNYKFGNELVETPPGTAHFFEHKIFAMPDGDAFSTFSRLGVEANAMTSYDQTSYLFKSTNHFYEALSHLLNMLDTPYFNDENIEKEKLIIGEELKMYQDHPIYSMQDELTQMLYHHHPQKHDIGGTLESIQLINKSTLDQVYKAFYHPKNRLMVIAGQIDLVELKHFISSYDQEMKPYQKPITIYPKEPKKLVSKSISKKKNIGINKLMLGIKLDPIAGSKKEKLRQELAMSLAMGLLLGPSSKFYEKLSDEKLINQSFSVNTNFQKYAENIIIYGESKRIIKLKRTLLDFLTKDLEQEMTEEAFTRYKRMYVGQIIYTINQLEAKVYYYGKYWHAGLTLFEVIDMLNEITLEDVVFQVKRIKKRYIADLVYKKA
ncbi:MAG: insulinase family protein [Acholeplasmataceae bacterium]|nr:insulinase family protein [Acholeplasmataceae bacterium]